jgi:hypothetical protein
MSSASHVVDGGPQEVDVALHRGVVRPPRWDGIDGEQPGAGLIGVRSGVTTSASPSVGRYSFGGVVLHTMVVRLIG